MPVTSYEFDHGGSLSFMLEFSMSLEGTMGRDKLGFLPAA
jgi:hypothetical protein